ncbi:MAG TPA: rhodanese-like domain-containing protein [Anaerolineales bacterium]
MNRNTMLIEADELLSKMGNENIRIFDATITDDVYLQEHIPGAAYFDHEKYSDPDSKYEYTLLPGAALIEQIGKVGISNDSEIIFYACGMLPYAARAWWMLRHAGHQNARVLNGGLSAWKKAGGTTEQESRQYEPSAFQGQIRAGMFVSKEDVMEALKKDDVATINVMPIESHEGMHITDSSNLSCMDLMQGMDYFQPNEELASRLKELAGYEHIITYCGGGIAATVNAMAHWILGQENVAVYDGSLYEWFGEGLPTTGNGRWEIWKQEA